jgi:hypothetical protein
VDCYFEEGIGGNRDRRRIHGTFRVDQALAEPVIHQIASRDPVITFCRPCQRNSPLVASATCSSNSKVSRRHLLIDPSLSIPLPIPLSHLLFPLSALQHLQFSLRITEINESTQTWRFASNPAYHRGNSHFPLFRLLPPPLTHPPPRMYSH